MKNLHSESEEDIPSCSPNGGCEVITGLLESKTPMESYFMYKRDKQRQILYNEEKIFELMNEVNDLIQENKNYITSIDEMFNDIIKH